MQLAPLSTGTDTDTRCAAVWQEMPLARIPEAQAVGVKVAAEFGLEATFHSHPGKQPTNDVLFGVRFCGKPADTFFAGREWEKAVKALLTPPPG